MLDKQTQILNLGKSDYYFHNCLNDFVKWSGNNDYIIAHI